MAREQLEPATTFFWVCDYVIRQGGVDQTVPALFTHVIRDIGRTLVFADPWDDPGPLRRAWCLWEILFGSEGALELILSTAQAARFRDALVKNFDSIQTKICKVDLRNSDTRDPDDKRMIFEEVEKQIGMSELDARVHAQLRAWLARAARAELDRLPAEERATSKLIDRVATLLQDQGELADAKWMTYDEIVAIKEQPEDAGRSLDGKVSVGNFQFIDDALHGRLIEGVEITSSSGKATMMYRAPREASAQC